MTTEFPYPNTEILLILELQIIRWVVYNSSSSMTDAFCCRVLLWCLLHIIRSVYVSPGHQRDRKKSENNISVFKTLLLSLTLTIVFSINNRKSLKIISSRNFSFASPLLVPVNIKQQEQALIHIQGTLKIVRRHVISKWPMWECTVGNNVQLYNKK